jgi:hypothetical protein
MKRALAATLGGVFVVACGGTTTPVFVDEAGSDAGAPGDAAANPDGADCAALLADVQAAQAKAVACCPTCHSVQCTQTMQGECCPLAVNDPQSAAAVSLTQAIAAYKAQCHVVCTLLPVARTRVTKSDR